MARGSNLECGDLSLSFQAPVGAAREPPLRVALQKRRQVAALQIAYYCSACNIAILTAIRVSPQSRVPPTMAARLASLHATTDSKRPHWPSSEHQGVVLTIIISSS